MLNVRFIKISFTFLLAALLGSISTFSSASIVITGTRVIYPASQKEVTVKLNNTGKGPVIIQSWIDTGDADAKPENIKTPFVLTPPMNRVDPGKSQTLRLRYTGTPLPTNKESVFYLNVLEIPSISEGKENANALNLAFRSRIKIFFRPDGLAGNANEAAKTLTWSVTPTGLRATNPSPYHVSLIDVTTMAAGKKSKAEGEMIAPGASRDFKLSGVKSGSKITYSSVNDYGAMDVNESVAK